MPAEILGVTLGDEELRLVTTVVVIAGVLVVYRGIYASGERLKRRFSDYAVEAGQALVGLVVSVAGLGFLLTLWAGSDEVLGSGGLAVDQTTSI